MYFLLMFHIKRVIKKYNVVMFSCSRKNKRKYQQIIAEKAAQAAGKRRKKNKFHKK